MQYYYTRIMFDVGPTGRLIRAGKNNLNLANYLKKAMQHKTRFAALGPRENQTKRASSSLCYLNEILIRIGKISLRY